MKELSLAHAWSLSLFLARALLDNPQQPPSPTLTGYPHMDSLKALVAAKRREVAAVAGSGGGGEKSGGGADGADGGGSNAKTVAPAASQQQPQKRYVRRGELEEARLKRLREEEEAELCAKRARQQAKAEAEAAGAAAPAPAAAAPSPAKQQQQQQQQQDHPSSPAAAPLPNVSSRDAFRRLRALGEPVTLFGEQPTDRVARLLRLERAAALADDEARGQGQPQNVLLAIKRGQAVPGGEGKADGGKAKHQAATKDGDAAAAAAAADTAAAAPSDAAAAEPAPAAAASDDPLAAAFAAAAQQLAAQRAEAALPLEERVSRQLREWEREWGDELEARRQQQQQGGGAARGNGGNASSTSGNLAHEQAVYRQTLSYLEPLHDRLSRRALDDELLTGLWMVLRHAQGRNYLAANDVYLRLAIGNKAWPIGVTSVGIHERSAREKIAEHTADGRGGAHIMADEASRKFLQAVKRLLGVVQRLRPTDPSRAADFNAASGALAGGIVSMGGGGAGGAIVVVGGGGGGAVPSDERAALRLADARGETRGLPAPPSVVDDKGQVLIPPKWDTILARERAALEQERRWAKGVPGGGGGGGGGDK